jgi:hypothetical protein
VVSLCELKRDQKAGTWQIGDRPPHALDLTGEVALGTLNDDRCYDGLLLALEHETRDELFDDGER